MVSDSILGYLRDKTILITGATGFLGMVLVEKILRVQPDVKRLYLLLRATGSESASHRMHHEILGKELFNVLREKCRGDFDSFISQKVVPVAGDVTYENLGINGSTLIEEMCDEIQIIFNSAATTNFDERYDTSLGVNTFGVLHMLNFANRCTKLEILLHVSTAYVCGERSGILQEKFPSTTDMKNKVTGFNSTLIEKNLVEEKLNELKAQNASKEVITTTMRNFGTERAKFYGCPNSYVFTKAMGEILLRRFRNNISVVIVRPTIVTSTYKEPFPGWIQGYRTVDTLFAMYGKGKLTCLLVDPMTVSDMIPVDMVINSIIVAAVVNANKSSKIIYQVGSSMRNPLKFSDGHDIGFRYFSLNPWLDQDGMPVRVTKGTILKSMATFRMYMTIRYVLPMKVFQFVNIASGRHFQVMYDNYDRKLRSVMRMVELYAPYLLFKGIFDDTNTEELRRLTSESFIDAEGFSFDPKCIDWEEYLKNTHFPGFLEHVLIK